MVAPLRVGLAGLGTVGAAVIKLIETEQASLVARCGRGVEVVAVCARSKGKDRGVDLKKFRWQISIVRLNTNHCLRCPRPRRDIDMSVRLGNVSRSC